MENEPGPARGFELVVKAVALKLVAGIAVLTFALIVLLLMGRIG